MVHVTTRLIQFSIFGCTLVNIVLMICALSQKGLAQQPALVVSLLFSISSMIWFILDFKGPFDSLQKLCIDKSKTILNLVEDCKLRELDLMTFEIALKNKEPPVSGPSESLMNRRHSS